MSDLTDEQDMAKADLECWCDDAEVCFDDEGPSVEPKGYLVTIMDSVEYIIRRDGTVHCLECGIEVSDSDDLLTELENHGIGDREWAVTTEITGTRTYYVNARTREEAEDNYWEAGVTDEDITDESVYESELQ